MRSTGNFWELIAETYLTDNGLKTLQQQYNCRMGEIDLIMQHSNALVFCEVRYRRSNTFGGALASVTRSKQKRIILAARHFLMVNSQLAELNCRFDVIAIHGDKHNYSIDWVQHAFET